MMVGEDYAVRAPRSAADATERDLSRRGLCNWLVDWSTDGSTLVYCGAPAHGLLCSEHRGTFGVPIGEGVN